MIMGLRTILIGYHNPILHSYYVIKAWIKIFNKFPNSREFICILLHDIGYINQSDYNISNEKDSHPLLGAKICKFLFGDKYYNFCIGHSRTYAYKNNIDISYLCYADKYSVLLISWKIHKLIYLFDSPKITEDIIYNFRESCKKWCIENKLIMR